MGKGDDKFEGDDRWTKAYGDDGPKAVSRVWLNKPSVFNNCSSVSLITLIIVQFSTHGGHVYVNKQVHVHHALSPYLVGVYVVLQTDQGLHPLFKVSPMLVLLHGLFQSPPTQQTIYTRHKAL